ncbi:MAG: replication-relaxation family protein [Deltaproteobacteria bacterium]|nr:replication-relaxation family protein [Deltaproteobacteria bacterium]
MPEPSEKILALLKRKIEEAGEYALYKHLRSFKSFKVQSTSHLPRTEEKVVLNALLRCPSLMNSHIFRLVGISAFNKARVAQSIFEGCNRNGSLVFQTCKNLGREGKIVVWYLSFNGYRRAIKICLPDLSSPDHCPAAKEEEFLHNMRIADIFCDIHTGGNCHEVIERIKTVNWLPRHHHALGTALEYRSYPAGNSRWNNDFLITDAIIHPENQSIKIFLEVDCNTKTLNQERKKLEKYADYFLKTDEAKNLPCLIQYSVDSKKRGAEILKIYDNLKDRIHLPDLRFSLHKETGQLLKKLLREYHVKT